MVRDMTISLSLAMIVKNEALVLERVLSQVAELCDECVVVDTGSTDDTVALAQKLGAKVSHFAWRDDFAAARNVAFSQCSGDWILWLDADDVISEASLQKLRHLKAHELGDTPDIVVCSYQIAFAADGECLVSMPRERLIRRLCGGEWRFPIHEAYVPPENARFLDRLDIAIEHRKPEAYVERSVDRNLNMLARMIAEGDHSPRTWYYYGKELKQHDRLEEAVHAFARHVEVNRDDAISRYQAMHHGMVCLMALERHDEALSWGMRALETDSSRAEVFTELGVIHYRQGQFAQAIPLLTAATVCMRPSYGMTLEENYTWRPYHYLSLCYEGVGDNTRAIEAALKALPSIPDKQVIQSNIQCFSGKLSGFCG